MECKWMGYAWCWTQCRVGRDVEVDAGANSDGGVELSSRNGVIESELKGVSFVFDTRYSGP